MANGKPGRPRKNPAPTPTKRNSPIKKKKVDLDAPPFESPGKKHGKPPKRESSNKSSNKFFFERLGDGNMCVAWVEKPSGEAGCAQPIDDIACDNTKEGKSWREHTNCVAPLVSRRKGRECNLPIPSKFKINLSANETSYPWRCFFACESDDIRHDDCIVCIVKQAQKVLDSKSTFATNYFIDLKESDKTENPDGPYRSLDEVILDKGVQTIIYRYFYKEHLTDENWNDEHKTCNAPTSITSEFVTQHADIAEHFFTPYNDEYSFTARSFGCTLNTGAFNDPEEDEPADEEPGEEQPAKPQNI